MLKTINFSRYMNPLAEEIRQEIGERGVKLVLENEPPNLDVRMEPQRLSRLFYNLLNNAVDEMSDGGKIFLRFVVDGPELRVEVEDTGRGIAPEIAQSLFKPFATHGKAHGTGLGLTICRKIVEDQRRCVNHLHCRVCGNELFRLRADRFTCRQHEDSAIAFAG